MIYLYYVIHFKINDLYLVFNTFIKGAKNSIFNLYCNTMKPSYIRKIHKQKMNKHS